MPDTTLTNLAGCCVPRRSALRQGLDSAYNAIRHRSHRFVESGQQLDSVATQFGSRWGVTPDARNTYHRPAHRTGKMVEGFGRICGHIRLLAASPVERHTLGAHMLNFVSPGYELPQGPCRAKSSPNQLLQHRPNRDFGVAHEAQLASAREAVGQQRLLAQLGLRPILLASRISSRWKDVGRALSPRRLSRPVRPRSVRAGATR